MEERGQKQKWIQKRRIQKVQAVIWAALTRSGNSREDSGRTTSKKPKIDFPLQMSFFRVFSCFSGEREMSRYAELIVVFIRNDVGGPTIPDLYRSLSPARSSFRQTQAIQSSSSRAGANGRQDSVEI